ncbi:hypothetical protein AAU57_11235 [Nonlabens sp. YIK11]|uniref:hypothetical protein n=1 Tax=Nonlabens sp. YIK11 TaxID=1453349 RepID=UPI0006DCDD0D|nr:hypothetical protein [Nonlabens sp. YIK11]KQC33838.1 hypothetical protein AAU57_11235 [Nonlabens sp. YIK11]
MKKVVEKRSLISVLSIGFSCGLLIAVGMALWDYFDNEPFQLTQFLFYMIFFGFFMGFSSRHKITKI